jgi:hypothetical protein
MGFPIAPLRAPPSIAMNPRPLVEALILSMVLTPGVIAALVAHREFGVSLPLALALGVAVGLLGRRALLAPVH